MEEKTKRKKCRIRVYIFKTGEFLFSASTERLFKRGNLPQSVRLRALNINFGGKYAS